MRLDSQARKGSPASQSGLILATPPKKIDRADLETQQPQAPRRHGIRTPAQASLHVQRASPIGRHERHQETHQADEVGVVQVARLLQQEDVGVAEAEQDGGGAVEQPKGDQHGQDAQRQEMHSTCRRRARGWPSQSRSSGSETPARSSICSIQPLPK